MPLPKELQTFYVPKTISVREYIKLEKEKGHIKKCVCGRLVGASMGICGMCKEKKNAEAVAIKNGTVFYRKGRKLSQEGREKIAKANKERSKNELKNN